MHCGYYYLNGSPALCSFIYVDVGEPTSHPCSMTEMIQDHHLSALQDFESLGTTICGICYDIAKQYWAAWGLSESVVFHVVSWGVFLGCVGLVLVGLFCCFCVCVVLKTPSFLLSPILQHVGIAYLRQNGLMTVWASSAHGMSSKKKVGCACFEGIFQDIQFSCQGTRQHLGFGWKNLFFVGCWLLVGVCRFVGFGFSSFVVCCCYT